MHDRQAAGLKSVSELVDRALLSRVAPGQVSNYSPEKLSRSLYTSVDKLVLDARENASVVRRPLYTDDERKRRDASGWTLVQGILAPVQFVIFLASLVLVVRYLATGDGYLAATVSIVIKTLALYAIMITGCIWEKVVFGRYLFARAFFWEDVFSMLVLALHTAYLAALVTDALDARGLMYLALAAYASYAINATQFLLKLRAARLDRTYLPDETSELVGQVR